MRVCRKSAVTRSNVNQSFSRGEADVGRVPSTAPSTGLVLGACVARRRYSCRCSSDAAIAPSLNCFFSGYLHCRQLALADLTSALNFWQRPQSGLAAVSSVAA
jgi:hypothetical protein